MIRAHKKQARDLCSPRIENSKAEHEEIREQKELFEPSGNIASANMHDVVSEIPACEEKESVPPCLRWETYRTLYENEKASTRHDASLDKTDWGVFRTPTEFLLALFITQCPSATEALLDSLLEMVRHPQFNPAEITFTSGRGLRKWVDGLLPALPIEKVPSTARHSQEELQLEYISPIGHILRTMSNPVLLETLRFGLEPLDYSSQRVEEFNQTPFANQHLKYSRVLSTQIRGIEVCVGSFVELSSVESAIFRLESIKVGPVNVEGIFALSKKGIQESCVEDEEQKEQSVPDRGKERRKLFPCEVGVWTKCPIVNRNTRTFDISGETIEVVMQDVKRLIKVRESGHRRGRDEWTCLQFQQPMSFVDPLLAANGYWFWLEIYIDGYESLNRHHSVGIYIRFSNTKRVFAGRKDALKLVMTIPTSADLAQALELLRKDLQVIRDGFPWWSPLHNKFVCIKGEVSFLLGDSIQVADYLRHGGNNSFMNCSTCLTSVDDRLVWQDVEDSTMRRTTAQTDAVIAAIEGTNKAVTTRKAGKKLLGLLGRASEKSYFGERFEPFLQTWRDPDHLFLFGLLKGAIVDMVESLGGKHKKSALLQSIQAIPWPKGLKVLIKGWEPHVTKSYKLPMRAYLQLSIAMFARAHLFVGEKKYLHFAHLFLFYIKYIARHGLTDEECQQACEAGEAVVLEGRQVANEVWDRPNGHFFIEFVQRLKHIRNAFLVSCGPFERLHQLATPVHPGAIQFESSVVKHYARQEAMRHFLTRGVFFKDSKLPPAAAVFIEQQATSKMLQGLMLRSLQLPDAEVLPTKLKNAGVWKPFERKLETVKWTHDDLVGLGSWRDNNAPGATIDEVGFLCCGMWWIDVKVGKQDVVHASDDVCVIYGGDYEFAKLQRLAIVYYRRENEVEAALVWKPLWYERLVDKNNNDILHDVRETVQVTLNNKRNAEWLNAADVEGVVMVLHSCTKRCTDIIEETGMKYLIWIWALNKK
jgi:hypothetical protein